MFYTNKLKPLSPTVCIVLYLSLAWFMEDAIVDQDFFSTTDLSERIIAIFPLFGIWCVGVVQIPCQVHMVKLGRAVIRTIPIGNTIRQQILRNIRLLERDAHFLARFKRQQDARVDVVQGKDPHTSAWNS